MKKSPSTLDYLIQGDRNKCGEQFLQNNPDIVIV